MTGDHRSERPRDWRLSLSVLALLSWVGACGGGEAEELGPAFDDTITPLDYWVESGTFAPKDATNTRAVRFAGDVLYTLSDRVQRWDAITGEERPRGQSDRKRSDFNGDEDLHVSSRDGFVGFSDGGRAYAGFVTGDPLFTATGTGYLHTTYVEGLDQFAAYDKAGLKFFDRKTGAFSTEQPISQGVELVVGGRGSYLTAVLDHRIVLWPVSEEGQGLVLSGHAVRVIEMAYNADESQAASVDADGVVIVWDLSTGAEVQRIQLEVSRAVPSASLVFHPRGEWLVAHGKGANILFWSVVSGELIHSIKVARHGVLDLDISDDGARLAVGTSYAGRYDQNRTQRQGRGEYDPQALTSGPALVFDLTGLWH